jgi:hypothetical protein
MKRNENVSNLDLRQQGITTKVSQRNSNEKMNRVARGQRQHHRVSPSAEPMDDAPAKLLYSLRRTKNSNQTRGTREGTGR